MRLDRRKVAIQLASSEIYTIAGLADRLDLSYSFTHDLATGKVDCPSPRLDQLCTLFRCTPNDILDFPEPARPKVDARPDGEAETETEEAPELIPA